MPPTFGWPVSRAALYGFPNQALPCLLQQTVAGGRIWRGDICTRRKNGEPYWIDTSIIPLADDQGQPFRYVAIGKELPPQ